MAQNPENPAAHHDLGSLSLRSGDSAEALDLLREARRLNPIQHNDRDALAAAYGRLLRPFQVFDRYLIRFHSWSPAHRWLLLAGGATFLLVIVNSLQSYKLLVAPLFLIAFNVLVAPISFEMLSVGFGKIVFRRDLDIAWYRLLPETSRIALPILIHVCVTLMALAIAHINPR